MSKIDHQPRAPRTAFVLSGGASLGAMQAGMLRALYERGITPDLVVGTSAGAFNAAFIASRPQTAATAAELASVWGTLHRQDIFPIDARTLFGGMTSHSDHLVSDRGVRRLASRFLQIELLEHAAVPLHLVAFDVLSGEEVRLSHGPAADAVIAAAAIPGILPGVHVADRLLVDGGVVDNTPISHAVELGADRIYVLATSDPLARSMPAPPHGALDAVLHAFMVLVGARLAADLVRYATEVELIVLPAANRHRVQPTDFGHASRLVGEALADARVVLDAMQDVERLAA